MWPHPLASVGLIFVLLTSAVGQQPAPTPTPPPARGTNAQEDVVRVTTNLVQVDVVVTDKEGRPVTDLGPEDFEISESKRKQPITNFSYIRAGTPPAQSLAAPAPARKADAPVVPPARLTRGQVQRTVALVVDDLGLSFESMGFVRQALKRFVDEQMQPGDLVAILRTSSGAGAAQQFTTDKRLLYDAIERVRWNPRGRGGLSPVASLREESAGSDFREPVQFEEEMEESRAGLYSVGTFGTVTSIVQGLTEMPGRKSLIFISEAFRLFSAQGRNVQLLTAMQRLTDQANAASVSIYTLDASGLQTDTLDASDREGARAYVFKPEVFTAATEAQGGIAPRVNAPPRTLPRADSLSAQAEQDSQNAFRRLNAMMDQRREARIESQTVLSYLAERTGGLALRNRNDLGGAMQRIMSDQVGYYLIGYRPDAATIDPATGRPRLRDLEVKVKRSGLTVRARSGYVGLTDEAQQTARRTREEQLAAALVSPFAASGVRVRLTSLFGAEPGSGNTYLRSLLYVDPRDLAFKAGADGVRTADLEVVAVAFGNDGRVVDQFNYPQSVSVSNEEAYQRLLQAGLVYVLNFPVKRAGAYQMRVAVRDAASERIGSASQFVEAPDLAKNRLALSGVVLSGFDRTRAAPPAGAAADHAATTAGGGVEPDPQTGPAVRRLRQGMALEYRYNIFNARGDAAGRPQLQTQMRLLRGGQPVFTGKVLPLDVSRQSDMKRLTAIGRLTLGPELTPGDDLLQVVVTDLLAPEGRRTATQWMDFEIVQ